MKRRFLTVVSRPPSVVRIGSAIRRQLSGFCRPSSVFCLLCVSLALAGCSFNVSHSPKYPTDYVIDGTYRVKTRLIATWKSTKIFPLLETSVIVSVPRNKWEAEGQAQAFEGFIEPGTKIKITKLEFEWNPEAGDGVWIQGLILDGKFAGVIAHLTSASRRVKPPTPPGKWLPDVPMVDPSILELVEAPAAKR